MKTKRLLAMMTNMRLTIPLSLAALSTLAFVLTPQSEVPFTGHGDPEALSVVYNRWKSGYESRGRAEIVRIGLNYSKALSHELTTATGQAALNLFDGHFQVAVNGLSAKDNYDVWLLDNHADKSANKAIRIGALSPIGDKRMLTANLDREQLAGFTLDAVAVAKAGETPQSGGLLFGSPGLLQRIYYNDRFFPIASIGSAPGIKPSKQIAPFEFLLPKMAQAHGSEPASSANNFNDLIAEGQKIFTKETFDGNGRTCSTCHRPDNNHTIDPVYIAKLPKNDPLFVYENKPQLAGLENPKLLRQFGLFVAHIDGFDKPPVLRSPSHLLGLANTLTFEKLVNPGSNPLNGNKPFGAGEFQQDDDYFHALDPIAQQDGTHTHAIGWSGDGASDGGSLRDFAKGAIKQHLPKTLARVDGVDFRLPTEYELDALEAYLLSLGRSSEINLATMRFKSPLVQNGLLLFDTKNNPSVNGSVIFGATANCNGCHSNAGAISSTTGGNPTRDTGVERMRDQLHHLADPNVAYDGGFGQELQTDCGPNFDQACYSDGSIDPRGVRPANHQRLNRFNTPSLIEAADTAPFFHNNSVTTLEETVAYYNTDAFNNSPGAFTSSGVNRQGKLDSSQVIAVAMFLRAINVLENIRSSNQLDQKAIGLNGEQSEKTMHLAIADTRDAIRVLTEAVINPFPEALDKLKSALEYERDAKDGFGFGNKRQKLLEKAIALKTEARSLIVSGG
jgi:mono/diheme cytochrome c family protein